VEKAMFKCKEVNWVLQEDAMSRKVKTD